MLFGLACSLVVMAVVVETVKLADLDGDQIVTIMQSLGDTCRPPPNNLNWAPLPANVPCGGKARCGFPKEWCAYKPAPDGTPDLQSLLCQALNPECTTAFENAEKQGLLAPPVVGGSSPQPSTPPQSASLHPPGQPPPHVTTPHPGTTPPSSSASTVIPPGGQCCDFHEYCCFWASIGECDSNQLFMYQLCQSSCGACGCSKAKLSQCKSKVAGSCSSGSVTTNKVCPCKSDSLINRDWHDDCGKWAKAGGCEKYAQFMKPMCKKSCKICK